MASGKVRQTLIVESRRKVAPKEGTLSKTREKRTLGSVAFLGKTWVSICRDRSSEGWIKASLFPGQALRARVSPHTSFTAEQLQQLDLMFISINYRRARHISRNGRSLNVPPNPTSNLPVAVGGTCNFPLPIGFDMSSREIK